MPKSKHRPGPDTAEVMRIRAELRQERVSDSGDGMNAGTAERIFEPFFTTKPVGLGTGLGLSMIHSIVARAKGSIAVTSTRGKGRTFDLMYPIAASVSATRPSKPPPEEWRVQQSA